MKRPLTLVVAATLLVGCRAPNGSIDPFLGRQTVPPPATGVATAPPGDAYYSAPANSGAATSPPGSGYAPPGGTYNYGGAAATRPAATGQQPAPAATASRETTTARISAGGTAVRSANPSERPPAAAGSRLQSASTPARGFQVNTNPTRSTLGPAATTASRQLNAVQPARALPRPIDNAPSTDINDLPARRSGSPSDGTSSGGFRPVGTSAKRVSYETDSPDSFETEPASGRTPRRETLTSADSADEYSHDQAYQWLRGRLEYSRIDDRWKLRYIPINGETDDFGGSVVLLGSRLLEGYKPGEMVAVYGSIDSAGSADSRGFAPPYRLERIVRQSEEQQ